MKPEKAGKEWRSKIVKAVGLKIGNDGSRMKFANSIMRKLVEISPVTVRESIKDSACGDLSKAIESIRPSIDKIKLALNRLHPKATFKARAKVWKRYGVEINIDMIQLFFESLSNIGAISDSEKKRGPKNKMQIELASMIAEQYSIHFEKHPTYTKTKIGMPGRSPFDRVCDVISDLLWSMDHPLMSGDSIGESARKVAVSKRFK